MSLSPAPPIWTVPRILAALALVAAWFALATVLGTERLLVSPTPEILPLPAVVAAMAVVMFLGAYLLVPGFRAFVLAQDIRFLTMMHLWRVVGFGFLLLYANDILPGLFAWPAGVGDVAIGIAALYMVWRLERDPTEETGGALVRFHLLGLLDFVLAVGSAALAGGIIPALVADGVTAAPLAYWPLSLFPTFLVPLFIILHLTVLLKVRALRQGAAATETPAPRAAELPL